MATFATMLTRLMPGRAEAAAHARSQRRNDTYRLRTWPNEDLLFPVKPIDNSRVSPKADRKDRSQSWKVMFGFTGAAALLIAVLLPSAYSLMAGYKLQELKKRNDQLRAESAMLDVEIARHTSPANLEQFASTGKMQAPNTKKLVYLQPQESVAMTIERK
ncbi:MAG: hypothetical protein JST65_23705 [Acidobacteria bacterium]|nr:hypothetical protein [Acidobacteriota bacterium]